MLRISQQARARVRRRVVAIALSGALVTSVAHGQAGADPARALFEQGSAALDARRWTDAIDALERARAIQPQPAVLFNLALACQGAGQRVRAVVVFEEYLARSSATASRRTEATRHIAELRAALAEVRLQVTPAGAVVTVDGQSATPAAGGALLLEPGSHTIEATAPGSLSARESLLATAGTSRELHLALRPPATAPQVEPPRDERPAGLQRPVGALVFIAAGSASLVAAGALYGLTSIAVGNCATDADALVCPTPADVDRARGAFGLNVAAHVTLGAGLALVGSGVLWYLFGGRAAPTNRQAVGVTLAPGYGALTVTGRF